MVSRSRSGPAKPHDDVLALLRPSARLHHHRLQPTNHFSTEKMVHVPPTAKPRRKRSHAAALLCTSLVAQHLVVSVSSFVPQSTRTPGATAARHFHHDQREATSLMLTYHDDDNADDNNEEDEEELGAYGTMAQIMHDDMIGEMIDSVDWMPSVYDMDDASRSSPSSIRKDSRILPLLPLSEVLTPLSDHTLSIYEPRYIELYDYLLDDEKSEGKPEFVVSLAHPSEDGVFASYGVLFKIKDFVEMDEEEAQDIYGNDEEGQLGGLLEESAAVKYVATHTATKIVKIRKVLNPASWDKEDTYLRVEAVITDDLKGSSAKEAGMEDAPVASASTTKSPRKWKSDEDISDLRECFSELVRTQHELKEDIKFTKDSAAAFARGISDGPRGFWFTVLSFQQFLEQRILNHHLEIQGDFQENLMDFVGRDKEAPAVIDMVDLPSPLKEEAQQIEARVSEELGPMRLETNLFMQKLIESDQGNRIKTLITMVEREIKRLQIKRTLKGIFEEDEDDDLQAAALSDRKTSRELAEAEQKQIEDFKRQLEQSFGATSLQEESSKSRSTGTDSEDDEEDDQEFGLRRFNAGGSFFFGSDDDTDAFQ